MLNTFFNPKSIAVVGVSENPSKLGSLIFQNIQNANFQGNLYPINPKNEGQILYGKKCFSSVKDIKEELDLVVLVIPAKFCSSTIDDCIINKTKNISIITAGFSEIGNKDLELEILKKCLDNNINLLGPNCLGHISTFNNLNASFAPNYPVRGNIAFISQSGAYCSALLDWAKEKSIGFSHFISIGNKTLLSEEKLLQSLKNDKNTKSFVFYLESLKNGKEFLKILKEVSKTKPCIIMEPGKSAKAQSASLSHTGSLAPNYKVLEEAIKTSGAIQVYNTRELFYILEILQYSNHYNFDGNIAILTNAGGVGVLSSDLCEDNDLNLEKPTDNTINKLKEVLPLEASLKNPIDIIGDAKADRYENALKILCESNEYKNILVFLTPQMGTDSVGTANSIVKISSQYKNINIFTSFIGGEKVREGSNILNKNYIMNFEFPIDIIKLLGLLKKQMKYKNIEFVNIEKKEIPLNIKNQIQESINQKLSSLPQNTVNEIMDYYSIDYPKSNNFTDKELALNFCKKFFPNSVVLKLSSPDALHKTEMKGIYLNIDNEEKFNDAWENLNNSIKKFNLKNASILIQEMILKGSEVIIGINSDKNFGKVMLFGTGGIYTEIMQDTTIRVLPTNDFENMIKETKIGTILNGVRGEKQKAIKPLLKTLQQIQQLIIDIPEIKSIDINPILITETRAVVVDFKILI